MLGAAAGIAAGPVGVGIALPLLVVVFIAGFAALDGMLVGTVLEEFIDLTEGASTGTACDFPLLTA